jgi:hypothetical protein
MSISQISKRPIKETITINEFVFDILSEFYYRNIDCLPVGQRLPVSSHNYNKSIEIIESILLHIDIGMITIMNLASDGVLNREQRRAVGKAFKKESIDGGHRKRAIWSYVNDVFPVNGKFFSELSDDEKKDFLESEISFTIYDNLDADTKGFIFRNLNKTTDVNFIEMLNSYGNIPLANYVREKVRLVKQIDNSYHELFEYTNSAKTQEPIYRYLSFDNDRLKQDLMFARIIHRYMTSPKELLGGTEDKDLSEMYENAMYTDEYIKKFNNKIDDHLDFLRVMATFRKLKFKVGLSQHDFKILSYLYFYLQDTYDSFDFKDKEVFYEIFAMANAELQNADGKYSKILHKDPNTGKELGYSLQTMYKKYIAAPSNTNKIKMAVSLLIGEMPDLENFLEVKDTKRNFTQMEKEAKLAEQEFVCGIDGYQLNMKDAHAAHIVAHANGGKTVYSNLVMVRAVYNREMGTMNLNTYRENFQKAA